MASQSQDRAVLHGPLSAWQRSRWDFISSENSTGFHSPQEAARVLAEAIDIARQAELKAVQIMTGLGQPQARAGQ